MIHTHWKSIDITQKIDWIVRLSGRECKYKSEVVYYINDNLGFN